MAFKFSKPNKTSTFFGQVDAGRRQVAGQKEPGIQGAVGTVQNQANAQQAQTGNVQKAQGQMIDSTNTKSLSGESLGKAEGLAQTKVQGSENFSGILNNKPVNASNMVVAHGDAVDTNTGKIKSMPTIMNNGREVRGGVNDVLSGMNKQTANAMGQVDAIASDRMAASQDFQNVATPTLENATGELGEAYRAQMDQKALEEKRLTEGNLGQMGMENAFEVEQAQKAALLAEENNNVGKLASLYGVGYDPTKFGALDSNILQGQLNEGTSQAKQAIGAKQLAQRETAQSRELYANATQEQRAKIDKEKTKVEGRIGELTTQINAIQEQLAQVASETGNAAAKAKAELDKRLKDASAKVRKVYDEYAEDYQRVLKENKDYNAYRDKVDKRDEKRKKLTKDAKKPRAHEKLGNFVESISPGMKQTRKFFGIGK